MKKAFKKDFMSLSREYVKYMNSYSTKHLNISNIDGWEYGFPPVFFTAEEWHILMNRVVTLDRELRTLLRMCNMSFKINILIPPTANSSYIIASSKIIKKYAEKLENIKLSMIFIIDLTGKINSLSLEDTYHVLREVSEITNISLQLASRARSQRYR